jgi:hypothetical protein
MSTTQRWASRRGQTDRTSSTGINEGVWASTLESWRRASARARGCGGRKNRIGGQKAATYRSAVPTSSRWSSFVGRWLRVSWRLRGLPHKAASPICEAVSGVRPQRRFLRPGKCAQARRVTDEPRTGPRDALTTGRCRMGRAWGDASWPASCSRPYGDFGVRVSSASSRELLPPAVLRLVAQEASGFVDR